MTKEEAIKIFNTLLLFGKCDLHKEEAEECFKMAVEALEPQPSERTEERAETHECDYISREALDNAISGLTYWHFENGRLIPGGGGIKTETVYKVDDVWRLTHILPSVTPQPKTEGARDEKVGHWIDPQQDDGMSDPIYYQVRCSECNFDLDPQTWAQELHQYGADKYCPRCGCRMQEVKNEHI